MLILLYSPRFARHYKKLSTEIKDLAERKELVFRKDPFDKSLKTHKLQGPLEGFYAFSITSEYRIIFDFLNKNTIRLYDIGNHDIYY